MRLKHGAFRHLRMAAKGAALGTRHLLKKVDENFGMGRLSAPQGLRAATTGEHKNGAISPELRSS